MKVKNISWNNTGLASLVAADGTACVEATTSRYTNAKSVIYVDYYFASPGVL
jgi:hypothetical protein